MHHVIDWVAERANLLLSDLLREPHRIQRELYRPLSKRVLLMHTVLILTLQELIHLLLIALEVEAVTSEDYESKPGPKEPQDGLEEGRLFGI